MRKKSCLDWKQIGRRLRQAREQRGFNMTVAHEIRELYGVRIDPFYLSRVERGKAEFPFRTLKAIVDFLGISASYLLYGEPDHIAEVPGGAEESDFFPGEQLSPGDVILPVKILSLVSHQDILRRLVRLQNAFGVGEARELLAERLDGLLDSA